MPEISRFFGIVIRMFRREHGLPHFHAEYAGRHASFDCHGNVLSGNLPKNTTKLVRKWAKLHSAELEENWRSARTHGIIEKIDPLTR